MKKNDILPNITIEKLIFGGSGLASAPDGKRIIISGGAIPGAIVEVRITRIRANHLEAQITRTITPSPLEQPIPEGWQLYGGVKWLAIPYRSQLQIKQDQIHEAFHSLLTHQKIDPHSINWHPIIASPESEHYRNKVEFSWGKYISAREDIHDEYRFGFHVPGCFDRIENCRYCVLADDLVNTIFRVIDRIARESGLSTYDPKTSKGFWRHLVIREGKYTHQIMIIFSVNSIFAKIPSSLIDTIRDTLSTDFPEIHSIYFLENTGKADIVTGNPVLIFGNPIIEEKLLRYTFDIQPKSFFQVNTLGAERLYQNAIDLIREKRGILLDLYAGTGTIGILLARFFHTVYSVELIASATEDGRNNAHKNAITNVIFENKKVEDFAREFAHANKKCDTIIVDPPRDGLHPSAIPLLASFGAREIIYISCNPATLVRDLELFLGTTTKDENMLYRITDIVPVDMFAHTHHIETIVRLERREFFDSLACDL